MRGSRFAKLLVIVSIFIVLPACGDDSPAATTPPTSAGAPSPTPPIDVPSSFIWERVHFSDLLPEPPSACTQPEVFHVTKDGTWTWSFCSDNRNGKITADELAEIDHRVRAVNDSGIGDEICLELSYGGRRILEIRFPPERDERVHDMGRRGSCFRAETAKVNDLEDYIDDLRVKYAGFTTKD